MQPTDGSAWVEIYIFQYNTRGIGGSDRVNRSTEQESTLFFIFIRLLGYPLVEVRRATDEPA